MALTRLERERISDSRLKIQSAASTLKHVDPRKIRDIESIKDCLRTAAHYLGSALQSDSESPL